MDRQRRRAPGLDRRVRDRLRRMEPSLGAELERLRLEASATKSAVAEAAGVDRTFYGRIEAGTAHPSIETVVALAIALGADASLRLFGGSGPRLVDRHQARMAEGLLADLAPSWRAHMEVPVWRPVRGVVDVVLERRDPPVMVITELQSTMTRLEQQLRWIAEKADAIGSSSVVGEGTVPPVSRLLVLRSTDANRSVARMFERTMAAAYPARTADAVASLRTGAAWPGSAIVWVRLDGDVTRLLDGPPRGVRLGR